MEFGRAADTATLAPPSLPPEHPLTARALPRLSDSREAALVPSSPAASPAAPAPTAIRVGLSTWGDADYRGTLYPADAKQRDFLRHYASRFPTVELSATFYATPTAERLRGWAAAVPDEFRFVAKVSRRITHEKRLVGIDMELRAFAGALTELGERCGPLLLQLPPSFAPEADSLRRLRDALGILGEDRGAPTAVELRSPGWFTTHVEPLRDALAEAGAPLVITDTIGAREVVHALLSVPTLVLRFVACGRREIDLRRADEWIHRIRDWSARGLRAAYLFVHEPHPTAALALVERFKRGLGAARAPGGADALTPGADRSAAGGQLELW